MLSSHKKTIFETLGRRPIHPFPARMAPGIALDALYNKPAPLHVLDPMAGSGTALAVARANGHRAYGFDRDPLAVLLARIWTQTIEAERVYEKAEEVLSRAKAIFHSLTVRDAYPFGSDDETRSFVRYWFDDYVRRQLSALSISISRVRESQIRDVLWCGFSRLIITKSIGASLAMDLSHSRPHKVFNRAPAKPFREFIAAVKVVASNCPQAGTKSLGPVAVMKLGDARKLRVPSDSIDLVLTSPPYLNAIDYLRCSKFSLVWMGHTMSELRRIRGEIVGAEAASKEALQVEWVKSVIEELGLKPKLADRDHAVLSRYVWDMGQALAEVSRVLKPKGSAVYVVGDSTVRGTFIRNSAIINSLAERNGLALRSRQSRALPPNRRYMPPPKRGRSAASMDTRMRREVVLVFDKPVN